MLISGSLIFLTRSISGKFDGFFQCFILCCSHIDIVQLHIIWCWSLGNKVYILLCTSFEFMCSRVSWHIVCNVFRSGHVSYCHLVWLKSQPPTLNSKWRFLFLPDRCERFMICPPPYGSSFLIFVFRMFLLCNWVFPNVSSSIMFIETPVSRSTCVILLFCLSVIFSDISLFMLYPCWPRECRMYFHLRSAREDLLVFYRL